MKCAVPPKGWACTRQPGHPGPCAAIPKVSRLKSFAEHLVCNVLAIIAGLMCWALVACAVLGVVALCLAFHAVVSTVGLVVGLVSAPIAYAWWRWDTRELRRMRAEGARIRAGTQAIEPEVCLPVVHTQH